MYSNNLYHTTGNEMAILRQLGLTDRYNGGLFRWPKQKDTGHDR